MIESGMSMAYNWGKLDFGGLFSIIGSGQDELGD